MRLQKEVFLPEGYFAVSNFTVTRQHMGSMSEEETEMWTL